MSEETDKTRLSVIIKQNKMTYIIYYKDSANVDSYEMKCESLSELLKKLLDILDGNFSFIKIKRGG